MRRRCPARTVGNQDALRGRARERSEAAMSLRDSFFAMTYDRQMGKTEEAGLRDMRKRLLAGAKGRVLEIGSGTGRERGLVRSRGRVADADRAGHADGAPAGAPGSPSSALPPRCCARPPRTCRSRARPSTSRCRRWSCAGWTTSRGRCASCAGCCGQAARCCSSSTCAPRTPSGRASRTRSTGSTGSWSAATATGPPWTRSGRRASPSPRWSAPRCPRRRRSSARPSSAPRSTPA